MKLENQVCSLELARKLKDLGVEQESLFWWSRHGRELIPEDQFQVHYQSVITNRGGEDVPYFSAFTVAELGEMLKGDRCYFSGHDWADNSVFCNAHRGRDYVLRKTADTEADARARMLIYLIENNLINA